MSNPHIINWVNPATSVDGATYTQAENTGYEIEFDGGPPIVLPGVTWATTFDMSVLPEYKALKAGTHTVSLAAVDAAGASQFTGGVTFLLVSLPSVPTNLSVA